MKPEECGTFRLTDEQKREIWSAATAERAKRAADMPDEEAAIRNVHAGWTRLMDLGWREATYAPCDRTPLLLIEAGSMGIHRGFRDAERRFWIVDRDQWPSLPMLFKLAPAKGEG